MKITYWSDYACPYCYIGETHLKTAVRELGMEEEVSIEMKAFELDPDASRVYTGTTVDRFARKYGLTKEKAAERIKGISEMGQRAGLDFRYAETRYTNTFDAHRLTKLARNKKKSLADRLSERLYHAYFAEGLELADHETLVRIAVEEGMEEAEVRAFLKTDKYADEVRLDEREAQNYGVSGVPFFLLAGKYAVPGALPVEEMKRLLKKVKEQEPEIQSGMVCGPDGCEAAE